jgi:predicted phosphodiesterase
MKTMDTSKHLLPQFHNLGSRSTPIISFGGPYGNVHAVRALRTEADRLSIPADHIICTGDIVAYGGDPEETVNEIREWGIAVVQGNVEQALAAASDTCECGYGERSACAVLSERWYAHCIASVSNDSKHWMNTLPTGLTLRLEDIAITVIHGGLRVINQFVFESTPESLKRAALDESGADLIVAGHSGLPFTEELDGRVWHNSGVIGLPANDGTPDVWYSLVEIIDGGLVIHHRRLKYDFSAAARSMRHQGLPEEYARCLETGLWPSDDILPETERAARGRPMEPVAFRFAQIKTLQRDATEPKEPAYP